MGHKVNPKGFRLNTTQQWSSKWFSAKKDYAKNLEADVKIRKFLKTKLKAAGVARIEVERAAGNLTVVIFTAKPGLIIGRGGAGVEDLRLELAGKTGVAKGNLTVNIKEVDRPQVSSELVLQEMVEQIEKRMPFRRVMKQAIRQVMEAKALGVKVTLSGRLNGAEIARTETLGQGRLPLHTLRADIDYARGVAFTTYGTIGIKVWVYRGDVFSAKAVAPVVADDKKTVTV